MSNQPNDQYYKRNVDPRATLTYGQSIPSNNPVNLPSQDYTANPLTQSQNVKIIPAEDSNRKYHIF